MVRTSTGAPGKAAWPRLPALDPSRALARISISGLLIDASTFSFSIALSCHAEHALGADYWALGKLGALSALFYSLTCLLTGGASDRLGSRPLVIASLAAMSATFLGTMLARTYGQLLLAGAFMGTALALFWPPIQRKVSRLSPGESLWRALGRFNVFWAVGVGLGTLTPALYASWEDPTAGLVGTLIAGLVVTLLAVPVLAVRMPEPPHDRPDDTLAGRVEVTTNRGRLFLHLAWIANFTVFFAMVGMVRVFPRISSDLGIPIGRMGWLLSPLDLGKIAAFILLARFAFWHYSFRWLAGTQGVAGLALIVAGLAEEWWLFLLLFPAVGALSGLTYFSSIYYGLNLREGEGRKSGIHETILSSGVCLGPLLCGLVGERYRTHPGAALVFGGAVVLAGLVLQVWLHGRRSAGAPAGEPAVGAEAGAYR
jgi:MFS family permease